MSLTTQLTSRYGKNNFINLGSTTLLLPPFPSEDDILIGSEWSRDQISLFLGFYRCYNKQLLKFITHLDFEKTYVSTCDSEILFFSCNTDRAVFFSCVSKKCMIAVIAMSKPRRLDSVG